MSDGAKELVDDQFAEGRAKFADCLRQLAMKKGEFAPASEAWDDIKVVNENDEVIDLSEDVVVENWHPLHSIEDWERLLKVKTDNDNLKDLYARIRRMSSNMRPLIRVPDDFVERCDNLATRFPNFREHIENYLKPELALEHQRRGPIKLSPCLFVGTPGVGKSYYLEWVAKEVLGVEFKRLSLETAQSNAQLIGSARFYSNADVGLIFRTIIDPVMHSNFLLGFDELEKCGGDHRFSPSNALLSILEPSTGSQFSDLAAPELRLDIRPINTMFTANSLEGISEPLMSRMFTIQVPPLTLDQAAAIALSQYQSVVDSLGLASDEQLTLTDDALETLAHESPRRQRLLARLAIGRALAEKSNLVVIPSSKEEEAPKRGMGFIW